MGLSGPLICMFTRGLILQLTKQAGWQRLDHFDMAHASGQLHRAFPTTSDAQSTRERWWQNEVELMLTPGFKMISMLFLLK